MYFPKRQETAVEEEAEEEGNEKKERESPSASLPLTMRNIWP